MVTRSQIITAIIATIARFQRRNLEIRLNPGKELQIFKRGTDERRVRDNVGGHVSLHSRYNGEFRERDLQGEDEGML